MRIGALSLSDRLALKLSPRELACVRFLADGKNEVHIAALLKITVRTVRFHVENAKAKRGAQTIAHLVALTITTGEISPPNLNA